MHPALAARAAEQDGVLGRDDLAAAGLGDWQRRRLVGHGWLRSVAPHTYLVAGAPLTHRARLRIGLVSLGEQSWISFEAAAALHGLDRSDRSAVEFTVPRRRRRHGHPFVVHTSKWTPPIDRVVVDGFRAMSATRTILDLALGRCHVRRLEAAIDSAVRLELSSPETIAVRLQTLRGSGRWGCRLVESLLQDAGGHTMLERRFLELVRRTGLPRPRTQVVHRTGSRHVARVDFLFDEVGVVVEVTGRLGHSTPTDRARDAQRRNELQDLGRKVYEYTWSDVTEHPGMVARTMMHRLRAAGLRW